MMFDGEGDGMGGDDAGMPMTPPAAPSEGGDMGGGDDMGGEGSM